MKRPLISLTALLFYGSVAALSGPEHDFEYYRQRGNQLCQEDRLEEAIEPYKVAVQLQPKNIHAMMDLANAYHMLNHNIEALETYKTILEINPRAITALYNFGFTLKRMGCIEQTLAVYEQVLALKPDYPSARFSRSTLYLTMGDLERGFEEYEWRWKVYNETTQRFNCPMWEGQDLTDHTLLVHAEQGLGDTFQFVRYLKLLKERFPTLTIVLESQNQLITLLTQQPYIDRVIARNEQPPFAHYQIPLMSIPRVVKTTLETIPAQTPYLQIDGPLTQEWKKKLADDHHLKVGICWHGNAQYRTASLRRAVIAKSVTLALLEPLSTIEGVTLYSLQRVTGEDQINECSFKAKMVVFDISFDQQHGRFMDTAAVMKNLDLVITVDTGTAHLAGALNVPTWIMLPFPADWRWLRNRTDSPWYPTVRLFQQTKTGEWEPVIKQIAEKLKTLVAQRTQGASVHPSEPTKQQLQFFKQVVNSAL
ncbi:tetratricopeptide repeat protein [Candidatus Dependentiae bacterium]|nr:MAG: tetratricopeptide repeat protein [Candidatus Dependentiae bacterium]